MNTEPTLSEATIEELGEEIKRRCVSVFLIWDSPLGENGYKSLCHGQYERLLFMLKVAEHELLAEYLYEDETFEGGEDE
jgi:hypothetical protein